MSIIGIQGKQRNQCGMDSPTLSLRSFDDPTSKTCADRVRLSDGEPPTCRGWARATILTGSRFLEGVIAKGVPCVVHPWTATEAAHSKLYSQVATGRVVTYSIGGHNVACPTALLTRLDTSCGFSVWSSTIGDSWARKGNAVLTDAPHATVSPRCSNGDRTTRKSR